jgi:hypothetical protein
MSLDEMANYCKTMRTKGTNMKKLDWTRLLGFEQIANERQSFRGSRLTSKVGGKTGAKPGTKLGVKLGGKGGRKYSGD